MVRHQPAASIDLPQLAPVFAVGIAVLEEIGLVQQPKPQRFAEDDMGEREAATLNGDGEVAVVAERSAGHTGKKSREFSAAARWGGLRYR
ncbi:hypothetical protein [Nocardia sp. NPDC003345]